MLEAQPMSYAEFCSGVEGDVLQPVFENGTVLVDTPWSSIVSRAKVARRARAAMPSPPAHCRAV